MTDLPVPATNPMAEVSSNSLDELFDRDPLELSKQDLELIVQAFRAQRIRWEADGSTEPKKAKAADKKANELENKNLSLDDLNLDIQL